MGNKTYNIKASKRTKNELKNMSNITKQQNMIKIKHFKILFDEIIDESQDVLIKCPVNELAKKIVKEYVIVWYDEIIESSEYQKYVEFLKKNHDVKIYINLEGVLDYLQKNHFTTFVFTSGANKENFVKQIHDLKHVKQVYVINRDILNPLLWVRYYDKVHEIENHLDSLIQKFKENLTEWQRSSSNWRLNLPAFQPTFNILDINDFNKPYIYLKCLINFKNRHQAINDFLELSRAISSENQKIQEFYNDYKEYDMGKLLHWYTDECFLSNITSSCLRIATIDSILFYRLIFNDLQRAIKDQYQKKSKAYCGIVYRGFDISDTELNELTNNVGKDIQMHGFMSTTKNRDKALQFFDDDIRKALFSIIILGARDKLGDQSFAELEEYSYFPEEQEVLFNIMCTFRVLCVTKTIINGSEHPNIILLYGANELKKFMFENRQLIQIASNDITNASCFKCKLEYIAKVHDRPWLLDIKDQTKFLCPNCLTEENIGDDDTKIMIPSKEFLSKPKMIKGFLMQPIKQEVVNGSMIKCTICKINNIGNKLNVRCLICKPNDLLICSTCSEIDMENCLKNDHIIAIQRNNSNIWLEEMTDLEYIRLQVLEENMKKKQNFNEGYAFIQDYNYESALRYYKECLLKSVSSQQQATIYENIGKVYTDKGQYDNAIKYHEIAIKIKEGIFGARSLDTANSYDNIGRVYKSKGEYDKAIEFHLNSIKIKEEKLEKEHIDNVISYCSIGSVYNNKGEYDKALEYFTRALKIQEKSHGIRHPDTATIYSNIGWTYQQKAKYEKALEYYINSLKIRIEILGEKHHSTAANYNDIGAIYHNKGESDKAMEYYSKASKILETLIGRKHPDMAKYYDSIGFKYIQLVQYDQALQYFEKALQINHDIFGEIHPSIGMNYHNIGVAYRSKGEYDKAMEFLTKGIKIIEDIQGKNHPNLVICLNNIGLLYDTKGQFDKAIECYLEALIISGQIYGKKHPSIATSYNNIGLAYSNQGKYDKAIEYYLKALKLLEEVLGKEHPLVIKSYSSIGSVYSKIGEYDISIAYLTNTLKATEKIYGEKHPETIISLDKIGNAYSIMSDFDKAIIYYEKALKIKEEVHGKEHSDLIASFQNIGSVYACKGEYDMSKKYLGRALEISIEKFGETHYKTNELLKKIGYVNQRIEQINYDFLHQIQLQ